MWTRDTKVTAAPSTVDDAVVDKEPSGGYISGMAVPKTSAPKLAFTDGDFKLEFQIAPISRESSEDVSYMGSVTAGTAETQLTLRASNGGSISILVPKKLALVDVKLLANRCVEIMIEADSYLGE